jgi:hypothetical protein
VTGAGYATPARLAEALAAHVPDRTAPLLDFGCGTGLSGQALRAAGFTTLDGTDITPGMLEKAENGPLPQALAFRARRGPAPGLRHHRRHRRREPRRGAREHACHAAGCARPRRAPRLQLQRRHARRPAYMDALSEAQTRAALLHDAYGPHLHAKEMGSRVYVLRKH